MLSIVSATRFSSQEFIEQAPLGASLKRLSFDKRVSAKIFFENKLGLSLVYNDALDSPQAAEILVFNHDDVWIDDYFLPTVSSKLCNALM